MTFSKPQPVSASAGRRLLRPMTLPEVVIASTLTLLIVSMILTVVVMAKGRLKSGQSQVRFQAVARYGTQKIVRTIQEARIVTSFEKGRGAYLIMPDDTVVTFYFEDADGNPETVEDNVIWYDPDPEQDDDEERIVSCVTPLPDEPIFAANGAGIAIRYHVGDPAAVSMADAISGKGYQGVRVHVVAKPRNLGHIWTSKNFDTW